MLLFALSFLIGDIYLQTFPQLPSTSVITSLTVITILLLSLYRTQKRYLLIPIAILLGFTFSAWYATSLLSWTLPKSIEGRPIIISGYISSLPNTENGVTHFIFTLTQWQIDNITQPTHTLINLTDRNNLSVKVGDKYQLRVRLKRIHGIQNLGGFDFEAWALQNQLRATGYIVSSPENILLSHSYYLHPIDQLRQKLQNKIKLHLPTSHTAPWLMALIIGERNGIAAEDWQILRNTGTNHLMAIAGLHIGIIAGIMHSLVSWLWRRIPWLVLRMPAAHAGAFAALFAACLYSALAGFSLPTERACIMLAVIILTTLTRRKINIWHSWSLALFIVLLLNPLSVLTESFWLSFSTIALIIYGMSGRIAPRGYWWKWGRVQWVIGIGLIPVTLTLFQQFSMVSFLANSIAIPWLGFFILPFCFLSGIFIFFSPTVGSLLLSIADKSLSGLWMILEWFSQFHFSAWQQAIPNHVILLMTITGIFILLLPAGFPGRWLGLIWIMPLLCFQPVKPSPGDFWLTLLDVGQGLSVIVQTRNHILVYDAGPKFNSHYDMGESVVLPYLITMYHKQIDMLVVSHGDNDHIGGAYALLKSLSVASLKTSVPEKFQPNLATYCLYGDSWQWDQVTFTFLYPTRNDLTLGNDSSCVLHIDNGEQSVLLTGDIEKYAENNLLKYAAEKLKATLLVAPHHGSKTSGLIPFIKAVHPTFVLYATGYRNRYHFPHRSVIAAYTKIQTQQLNTADTGMIFLKVEKGTAISAVELYRRSHRRYWFDN